eukprot:CAMPEP_0168355752 /NCGR_PEP_ID=MMETSP0213-20121227/24759_1 /TAXON_ID=151035 /ORGANISM="Euplotes harpa, Strain FSP1.4" /LENGTH=34 /DNA_ID= /DNA_START= /DNA_END= /DNA_ORIENTATION=
MTEAQEAAQLAAQGVETAVQEEEQVATQLLGGGQ